jgi:hypothetical protein
MSTTEVVNDAADDWAARPCGMIFEFKSPIQAAAFAAEVKRLFDLDTRVFDDAEAAARSHHFPWEQYPPVVHVDRPWWGYFKIDEEIAEQFKLAVKKEREEWRGPPLGHSRLEAPAAERMIRAMAEKKFGGTFVGT